MSIITFIRTPVSRLLGARSTPLVSGNSGGVFDSLDAQREGDLYPSVSESTALKLSAVLACVTTRAETIGSLPIHLRDSKKRPVKEHDLYGILHDLPNSFMTSSDYGSMSVAKTDLQGNQISIIARRSRDRSVVAINPLPPDMGYEFTMDRQGRYVYRINGEDFDPDDVLHMKGFSLDGFNGLSRLQVGRHILAAQYQGDVATMRAFQQGLKVGGFFKMAPDRDDLDDHQFKQFMQRMATFSSAENQAKWMPLPPGMEPVATGGFKINPVDVELLASRHFGIEEICRLFNVPPPLIGHTSKASSWASSTEQLNLHFLMYSLQPTLVRREKTFWHKLLTPAERKLGLEPKYSVEGLLRADVKTRQAFYASGLQNGYLSQNEVRDMEDRPGIGEEGDVFRVQLNMAGAEQQVGSDVADDQDKK